MSLRIIWFIFLCLFFGTLCSGTSKDLESIQRKIDQKKRIISIKKREEGVAKRSLGQVVRQLRYTEYSLRNQKKQLSSVQNSHREAQQQLVTLKRNYEQSQANFESKLVNLYKHGTIDFLAVIFSQEDLFSLLDLHRVFGSLLEQDIELFDEIKTQHIELKKKEAQYNHQKKRMIQLKKNIEDKERRLVYQRKVKKRKLNNLRKDIRALERHVGVLESSSRELMSSIAGMDLKDKTFYGSGKMIKPVKRAWISSRYGVRRHPISRRRLKHNGIDFAAPRGYKIKATDSGVVIVSGQKRKYRGYGKVTVLDHGIEPKSSKRMITVYAHQSRIFVKPGDVVRKGDVIGLVGSTGYSTGPHLHFEVRLNGVPVNPSRYMRL